MCCRARVNPYFYFFFLLEYSDFQKICQGNRNLTLLGHSDKCQEFPGIDISNTLRTFLKEENDSEDLKLGPGNWNLRVCIGSGKVNRRKS